MHPKAPVSRLLANLGVLLRVGWRSAFGRLAGVATLLMVVLSLGGWIFMGLERSRFPWIMAIGLFAGLGLLCLWPMVLYHLAGVEQARRRLEAAQGQLEATLANISQGVCFFAGDQTLVVSNRRYAEVYCLDPDAIQPGMKLADIVELCRAAGTAPVEVPEGGTTACLEQMLQAGDRLFEVELQDGRILAMQQRLMPDGGWVATHEDITERRRAEAEASFLATHDQLTGLANRSVFHELIQQALPEAARGRKFAILFLDLDGFKGVNDTLGHKAGDDVLKTVAGRLRATTREIDTIARFGGDEFVILQRGLDTPADTIGLAQRIVDVLCRPYMLDGRQAKIGVSIGIAMAPDDGSTSEALLKNADLALYLAKSEGRGTFRFFEPEMDAKFMRRLSTERDLRTAIAEAQFELYYQPSVDIVSGDVCAFEALIRWNHPAHGQLRPASFIPIAEECGLIGPIGAWVLRQACVQATQWPEHIRVAVNLSPVQFSPGDLVETVASALAESGLAPRRLELEITETVLLASSDVNVATLHRLRGLGVTIAMDDFGVGYSSLSYLHCFAFDRLKLDRSFVANMLDRREARFIVRAVIGLCRDLHIPTTVEGVETQEQLSVLRREQATHGQGYLFGKPMPATQIEAFLARQIVPARCVHQAG